MENVIAKETNVGGAYNFSKKKKNLGKYYKLLVKVENYREIFRFDEFPL